ncbi:MAG: restriction endonuclease [Terriglobia bacterium]
MVRAIAQLPRNQDYHYVNPVTRTRIIIDNVVDPEGPITMRRYNPARRDQRGQAKKATISSHLIWRVANAFSVGVPLNFERVVAGSYNVRSVVEALLAHTPQFYYCFPGRIETTTSSSKIKAGHKHLLWLPDEPHEQGVMVKRETELVISEVPSREAIYEALVVPEAVIEPGMDIEVARRHAQIQIALVEIGKQLGFRTWVAQNDRGITYKQQRLGEMEGVIARLEDQKILQAFDDARHAAALIDCIWFKNDRLMPAVIEIEHTTGVRSGLTRMKNLQDRIPAFPTRWVIAAPDDARGKVIQECALPQFATLNARYFPYSAVEELYSLCQRRKIQGVSERFLDSYIEPITQN